MKALMWGWPIWIYLWAAGVAGGGYFTAFVADRFSSRRHKLLMQIATWLGMPLVLLGSLLLVIDLGNPIWAWHLFVRFMPVSPMSLGSWMLLLWSITGIALIALWFAEIFEPVEQPADVFVWVATTLRPLVPATEVLVWIAFVLAALLITYTGVLLSNTSVSLWATVLLPVLFVVSAISTGTAAILLVLVLLGKEIPEEFGRTGAILAVLEMVALIGFLATVPAGVLITGPLSIWFWVGVVVIGLVVPFGLELGTLKAKQTTPLVLASTLCVLLGGLILRAVVVIGGQISMVVIAGYR
jgi:formate-dependent nitrite reductase membrane component NrfD